MSSTLPFAPPLRPPYTPAKPPLSRDSEELRAAIPGWGADLNPADRPSVPRERFEPLTGDHGEQPERQAEARPRERSVEHTQLPPVFGTTCPLKGLSGVIRGIAYARYSEGQAAHWLLLVAGDRVDVLESAARSFLTLRPDNPFTQTGILAEGRRHGLRSRLGHRRADVKHQWMDPFIVGAPWVLGGWGVVRALRLVGRVASRR